MKLEMWMSYWMQPHGYMYGERKVKEGVTVWVFTHPSTRTETLEILEMLIEDHPHLTDLLNDFEYVRVHRFALNLEGLLADIDEEKGRAMMHVLVEESCVHSDDGQAIWTEFFEGKSKEGTLLSASQDPTTHAVIMDAFNETCRIHNLSVMLNGDQEVASLSGGLKGQPPVVEKIMGAKMIDAKLAEFRDQLASWHPGGGES